ncbi:unnamed protein product [Cyberlindnera jadinii]|uniref:Ribosomal RNA-processing protein 17 n=1 Tax=Cyberlindnera jadinii (strain ATCC 18201 / CBS 1600 / BCRC 20928 / JCM 3617 / NBRC 0987 / NRRL Y-1542) TaxID=983966 RepID=A0A0H5C6U9_CYBJN|nr:hypothetical protein CYBJADRAFT_127533 [Cyberlindnera jadinii NRRL Y-1542]ODV73483.1 hypothetical protein CYBJADRAFT_127533 [Cyberlindnera jadinii NRRL Y-1542]CEP23622.1 unnamed protein product [Cyberlindnera jadinii]
MARTNREILTGGKKYTNNKAKKHLVEEVVFDKGSREEYLTGFHKRKLERQKKAQLFHKEQDRQAKIEERKQAKLEREKELLEQMEKYKEQMRIMNGGISDDEEPSPNEDKEAEEADEDEECEEWCGFADNDDDKPKGILKKKELYGEDGTEVVIEEMETDDVARLNYVILAKSKKILEESIDRAQKYAVIAGAERPKTKKKKFRYLSKVERRDNRRKAISNKRRK